MCSLDISAENIYSMQTQAHLQERTRHCQKMHLLLQIIQMCSCQHVCTSGLTSRGARHPQPSAE